MSVVVRTAGMCNGTPDWQLDRMFETDSAKQFEEAFGEIPDYSKQIGELEEVRRNFDRVIDDLKEAEKDLIGTGYDFTFGMKIHNALNAIEDVDCDIKAIITALGGEV